ncbi:MAG: HD domain-containing protein [Lachnospiraceae bacterium]|nr:HD domain-containing protein [Lachnospiraceae bacterium]
MEKKFAAVAMNEKNPKWECAIKREEELYARKNDIRTEFARDYTRILHSLSYRRLKHKTQVFFNVHNDHICTRMEHVLHVESVSATIADALGLNSELVKAIAMGHDLGHAPFGHSGEAILSQLEKENLGTAFWHEQNGIWVVDYLDLLDSPQNTYKNLNLTYAVRDGIISHCGEVDENGLIPREDNLNLYEIQRAGQYNAYTWEGCVVKIADKIAYLGRDIEDALMLGIIKREDLRPLMTIAKSHGQEVINTSVIMHEFVIDLIRNSSMENGICLSDEKVSLMKEIKDFNYENIYHNKKLKAFSEYSDLIIRTIFDYLKEFYSGKTTLETIRDNSEKNKPLKDFYEWVIKYCEFSAVPQEDREDSRRYENRKLYGNLENREVYARAVFDYIAGMTDTYAITCFNDIITF